MTQTKAAIISQLTQLSGGVKSPGWETMPVYKLLVELDKLKTAIKEPEPEHEDLFTKMRGSFT